VLPPALDQKEKVIFLYQGSDQLKQNENKNMKHFSLSDDSAASGVKLNRDFSQQIGSIYIYNN
jgi:hypothetical protein